MKTIIVCEQKKKKKRQDNEANKATFVVSINNLNTNTNNSKLLNKGLL